MSLRVRLAGAALNPPWTIPEPIPDAQFRDIRLSMIFDHHKWDSQFEDAGSLGRHCLILDGQAWELLRRQSESLWAEALAAEEEILDRPDLCRDARARPTAAKRLHANRPEGPLQGDGQDHAIRLSLHREGWRISEANADVPGGFIESCAFAELACGCYPGTRAAPDVGRQYARVAGVGARQGLSHRPGARDGVYRRPPGDGVPGPEVRGRGARAGAGQSCGSGLGRRSRRAGSWRRGFRWHRTVLPGGVAGESSRDRHTWERYFHGGATPQSNPGYSLIPQSKRFPLVWDRLATNLPTWRALLPQTCDPREVNWRNHSEQWVLKPALGRVGEWIGIRGITADKEWRAIARNAAQLSQVLGRPRAFRGCRSQRRGGKPLSVPRRIRSGWQGLWTLRASILGAADRQSGPGYPDPHRQAGDEPSHGR